jgi:hypothetical protein
MILQHRFVDRSFVGRRESMFAGLSALVCEDGMQLNVLMRIRKSEWLALAIRAFG